VAELLASGHGHERASLQAVDAARVLDAMRARAKDAELEMLRAAQAPKEQQQAEQSATHGHLRQKLAQQGVQLEAKEQG